MQTGVQFYETVNKYCARECVCVCVCVCVCIQVIIRDKKCLRDIFLNLKILLDVQINLPLLLINFCKFIINNKMWILYDNPKRKKS